MQNVVLLLLLFADAVHADDRLSIYTVNYPLQYFAERIAGDRAEVVFPGPADQDPAFWTPSPETLAKYQKADLILLNGASYAKWIGKVSLPLARTVDTSKAFREQFISRDDSVTHSHGPAGDHAHAGTAVTTWLDFDQAARQAEAILTALSKKRPAYKTEFKNRYATLRKELMQMDLAIQQLLAKHAAKPLLASHPVYQYFARRYDLQVESVLWEPDAAPGESEWQELALAQANFPALWMLWESQPLVETRNRMETLNIQAVVFDPCANRPLQGDFMTVMQGNIDRLGIIFQ